MWQSVLPSAPPISLLLPSSSLPLLLPLSLLPSSHQLAEMRVEYQRENEDILDNIRQIAKEVQLQALTMDYFIPQEYQVGNSTTHCCKSLAYLRPCRSRHDMCYPLPTPCTYVCVYPQTVLHDHAEWHEDTGEWHVVGAVCGVFQ